jgi:uncharacterized membrane protein
MQKHKPAMLGLLFLVILSSAEAAIIYGDIYDMSLNRVLDAILEINTTPVQRIVAANGSYSLELPKGNYRISFYYVDSPEMMAAEEFVSVGDGGKYQIDLLLYPDFSEEYRLSESLNLTFEEVNGSIDGNPLVPLVVIMILVFSGVWLYWLKNRKKKAIKIQNPSDDKAKLIQLMKDNGGRLTQKDLRKNFPYSEAKISLLVSELEADKKLRKIKRGRTNILILIR